jgi:hypothetical protein
MNDQLERGVQGSGRGLYQDIPAFAWRDWGKQRKLSIKIDGVPAEIRTRHLSNASRECYDLGQFA